MLRDLGETRWRTQPISMVERLALASTLLTMSFETVYNTHTRPSSGIQRQLRRSSPHFPSLQRSQPQRSFYLCLAEQKCFAMSQLARRGVLVARRDALYRALREIRHEGQFDHYRL